MKIFAPLLLLSALVLAAPVAPASAAPAVPAVSTDSMIVPVQMHRRGHARPGYRPAPRYTPGRRYNTAPRGWHRHGRRPGDWRNRGCVMVGPLWYCP